MYRPPAWHFAQSTDVCAPVSGKLGALWLAFAGRHALVLWQFWHCVGYPAAAWFGFVVAVYFDWWHE